jgi:hypothetical protein
MSPDLLSVAEGLEICACGQANLSRVQFAGLSDVFAVQFCCAQSFLIPLQWATAYFQN